MPNKACPAAAPVGGPGPRIYVMVDEPPEMLDRAIGMGATKLWDEEYWAECDARRAAFRDPWGTEVVLWRNKGTYVPGSASEKNK